MSFIPFEKASIQSVLPEYRDENEFIAPDVYMNFGEIKTMYIFDDTVEKLDKKWKDKLTLWWGELDFNTPNTEHEYDYVFTEYEFVDFAILPQLDSLDEESAKNTPLAWKQKELFINTDFIEAIKEAGVYDVWFDRLY